MGKIRSALSMPSIICTLVHGTMRFKQVLRNAKVNYKQNSNYLRPGKEKNTLNVGN